MSDLFGQSSPQEDGLFGSEGTPFAKKGGLFSGGGNLFDDVEGGDKVLKKVDQVLDCTRSFSLFVYFENIGLTLKLSFPVHFNLFHPQPSLFLYALESPLWCFSS